MKPSHGLASAVLTLLASVVPLAAQDRVLASGDPPLTEAVAGTAAHFYEWALDIRLNEAQYREFERLLVGRWQQPGGAAKADVLKAAARWGEITSARVTVRNEIQPRLQDSMLVRLRASAREDDAARWLLARFAEAHQVLASGNLPLTQVLADRIADYWEWLLDLRLSDRDRRELQQITVAEWGQHDAAWKREWISVIPAWWTSLVNFGPVERTVLRLPARAKVLAEIRTAPNEPLNRWRFAKYQAAHRPGGDLNPVLVPGAPALTQDMVTQYCDFIEWRWRLRLTGIGAQQRRQFQQLIAADWRRGDQAAKQAFLTDLNWWLEVFPGLSDAQRQEVVLKREHGGAYLERLHQSPNANARGWYLALEGLAIETLKWQAQLQNMYVQTWRSMIESNRATMLNIAGNLAPSGRYTYNPATGAYDRYVTYVP